MESILTLWESYRRAVVPPAASETQVQECRRAFYAGVVAMYGQLLEIGANDDLSEDESHAHLAAVGEELEAFKDAVGSPLENLEAGKAGTN